MVFAASQFGSVDSPSISGASILLVVWLQIAPLKSYLHAGTEET